MGRGTGTTVPPFSRASLHGAKGGEAGAGHVEWRWAARRPVMASAALLGAVLSLGGCACSGPRYYGEPGREVGYQPMGQQKPSAEYARDLERRLDGSQRNR